MQLYPNNFLKSEYLKRYKERNSHKDFIEMLDNNWDNWIDELKDQKDYKHIKLQTGQYLQDIL